METKELTESEWESLKPYVVVSSYGVSAEFFNTPEDILTAAKIVTLNGSPIKTIGGKIQSDVESRLTKNNTVVKIPNTSKNFAGKYAVMSLTLAKKAGIGVSGKIPEGL